ncbi:hypothetical protein [Streptomyces rimosus]|uniref:hypothetical protein n=1 Tax=Streptomyces rimosus TaxID=1927 RepID=UPI0037D13EBF
MTTTFNPRVILAKETDVLTNPDLWEQNANLSARLHQVSRELDTLKRQMTEALDEAMDGEIELIRMMWEVADQRDTAALLVTACQETIASLNRELAEMTGYRDHHRAEAEEWKRKYEALRRS